MDYEIMRVSMPRPSTHGTSRMLSQARREDWSAKRNNPRPDSSREHAWRRLRSLSALVVTVRTRNRSIQAASDGCSVSMSLDMPEFSIKTGLIQAGASHWHRAPIRFEKIPSATCLASFRRELQTKDTVRNDAAFGRVAKIDRPFDGIALWASALGMQPSQASEGARLTALGNRARLQSSRPT